MSDPECFAGKSPLFEQQSIENGLTYWSANAFGEMLGHASQSPAFLKAINKAQQVCLSLDIPVNDHFKQCKTFENGKTVKDLNISRFACYLVSMNGDPKKQAVAKAQAYFATLADACQRYIDEADEIERVLVRGDMSDREKTLSSTAKKRGVQNYAYFQSAGYLGLYNMRIGELRKLKQVPKGRSPLDFMGKDELAANLFRITQTEAKVRNENIRGQSALEKTAEKVGKQVRQTMEDISGQRPEELPRAEDIRKIKSRRISRRNGSVSRSKEP